MKRKLRAPLIMVAALTMLLAACTIVIRPSGVEWSLHYKWNVDNVLRYAVWTLYSDGTFADNYGGTGYWNIQGNLFQLSYTSYTYSGTVYTGNIYTSSYMSGTMQGPDSYGITRYGTWEAFRGAGVDKSVAPSSTGGLTPSGDSIE
jgi:hypothetical protein